MTHGVLQVSAIALGLAALVSFSPLSAARADTSATGGSMPSLSEPVPTPSWATSPGSGATEVQRPAHTYARRYAHHYTRHYHAGWPNNPVVGVVGGLADLGSLAAYPVYCFPNYGSCPVYRPY